MAEHDARTILIVEDEEAALMALGDALKQEGYTVLQAQNGRMGLDTALEKHPDMILTDLKMPEMDGLEMMRELRKDEWGKAAKVIILTNLSDMESLQEALNEEAFHYFVKGDTTMAKIVEAVNGQFS